jgi:hypothetical protein
MKRTDAATRGGGEGGRAARRKEKKFGSALGAGARKGEAQSSGQLQGINLHVGRTGNDDAGDHTEETEGASKDLNDENFDEEAAVLGIG